MRPESLSRSPLGRVGSALGWGYGGRVPACALTQGKVDRSPFLRRIKLIVLLVLTYCCFSQPSVNRKQTGNFLLLEVTMDYGSSIFIQVRVLCLRVRGWIIWCGMRFSQSGSRTPICPRPKHSYLPIPLACQGLNRSPAFQCVSWYPQFDVQVPNKDVRCDRCQDQPLWYSSLAPGSIPRLSECSYPAAFYPSSNLFNNHFLNGKYAIHISRCFFPK